MLPHVPPPPLPPTLIVLGQGGDMGFKTHVFKALLPRATSEFKYLIGAMRSTTVEVFKCPTYGGSLIKSTIHQDAAWVQYPVGCVLA